MELVRVAPKLEVSSADYNNITTVPHEDLDLTFADSEASHRALVINEVDTGKTVVCGVDSEASSFTIPKDVFAAGKLYTVQAFQGNLRELKVDGRRFVSVSITQTEFAISVESEN